MEKKTSVFLIILLCILVAVAGGSVSYYYLAGAHSDETQALEDQIDTLESNIAKQEPEAKKAEIIPIKTTSTPTTTDPTTDWKTFSNENLKISFKYPATWGTATYATYAGDPDTDSQGFAISFSNSKIKAGGINKGFTASRGGAPYETNATIAYNNGSCTFNLSKSTESKPCQKFTNKENQSAYFLETNSEMFGSFIEGYIPLTSTTFPSLKIENSGTNTSTDQSLALNDADKALFKTLLTSFTYVK